MWVVIGFLLLLNFDARRLLGSPRLLMKKLILYSIFEIQEAKERRLCL